MRLVLAAEMREMDRLTIQELGIPGVVLMENAARGATRLFMDHFSPRGGAHVVVLCGPGNNGGDGYVMARYLHEAGLKITVLVLSRLASISGDALTNLDIIRRMNLEIKEVPDPEQWERCRQIMDECHYIIDGILGTGLNSPVRGFYRHVIEEANSMRKPIMAIDIPSGVHADTGQIMGTAIEAGLTVTFGFPKPGQLIFPGAGLVGRLTSVDIGIPEIIANRIPARYHMMEPIDFTNMSWSEKQDIHKGNRGHLLVLAGSTGKTGAATLTALGALRAGAGLVTVGVPKSLNPILENKLTEAMTVPLPETPEGSLSLAAENEIGILMDGKTALAIGPGISTHEETVSLIRHIIKKCPLPMVIDADGLNALSGEMGSLAHCKGRVVLTPHPGEMGRLTGMTTAAIQADRIGIATRFAGEHGCCLVLKGAGTLVAEPEGRIYINPTGNPALSSGGSGDVLTGFIGGFLARRWPLVKAALGGVYLHGIAADLLAEEMGETGVLAGELHGMLPGIMHSLSRGRWPL
ncbi:MAG: NAD(P)H-hydrate dehydratase, partial [Pseudomonadota bacterium]